MNPQPQQNTDWTILKAEKQGRVTLCRLRKTSPPVGLSTLITIEWTYPGDDYNGFPSPDLRQAMDKFEDVTDDLCDASGFSRLMLVLTGLGLREWAFYSSDYDTFMCRFNDLMKGQPAVPIKIVYSQDPEGKYWMKYRKHVG